MVSALNSGYKVGSSRKVLSLIGRGARGVFFSGISVSVYMIMAVRNSNRGRERAIFLSLYVRGGYSSSPRTISRRTNNTRTFGRVTWSFDWSCILRLVHTIGQSRSQPAVLPYLKWRRLLVKPVRRQDFHTLTERKKSLTCLD